MRVRLTAISLSAIGLLLALVLGFTSTCREASITPPPDANADVIVIGAGIAGLSAALEAARGGRTVLVVDMASVFGGHAVVSHGGLSIIGSPVQEREGINDSAELANEDFMKWGEDADAEWVRYYVETSREEIYDWLTALGVEFEDLEWVAGNRVPRFHNVRGRGLGLVSPIYLACLDNPDIGFRWNARVDELIIENNRVSGAKVTDTRTGNVTELRSMAVVVATGGFQSNLELVRQFWTKEYPFPERILAGSGWNSQGSGLELVKSADAGFHRLDHQWNYVNGIPDPRYPESNRGVNGFHMEEDAIWVNTDGERFVNECLSPKQTLPAVLKQPTGSHWLIFDEKGRETFIISGSGWSKEKVDQLIFGDDNLVKSSSTLEGLATGANMPPDTFVQTVRRYNDMVDGGVDDDFGRFSPGVVPVRSCKVRKLDTPPFYAVRRHPLARKSMGGIDIDRSARVLDADSRPIPGLYAAGEATGMGGINGKAGLEGTFLGPSIVIGRMAGRTLVEELEGVEIVPLESRSSADTEELEADPGMEEEEDCLSCHDLEVITTEKNPGYFHFELSHTWVLEQEFDCLKCHEGLAPFDPDRHMMEPRQKAETCKNCHGL